jgi:iron complex outermembrane receptor protein
MRVSLTIKTNKKMKKNVYCTLQLKPFMVFAMAIFLPFVSHAQYSISGKVKDKITSESLAGATVLLENTYRATATNSQGDFVFKNLKAGDYIIRVSYIGYATTTKQISLNADIQLEFELEKSVVLSDEVIVSATRIDKRSALTFTNVTKEQIEKINLGQDIPILLDQTPSVVTHSDAGAGVGYTGIRIRGSDPTRINVTINGIPMNDAESHGVWWVNMPDLASSVDNIQIQRGVGTSTNGAAAFGASINIQTTKVADEPYAEISNSYGSFNTLKHTAKFGTGLLPNKWSFDGRLSKITSDGFIDRASSDLKAYFLQGGYYGEKTIFRAIAFSGKEKTYQAWFGIPEAKLKGDENSLLEHYYNNLGVTYQTPLDSLNLFSSNRRTYNPYMYKDETDNYQQDNYQLHITQQLHPKLTFNTSFHYTYGRGYYEQFRYNDKLSRYGLENVVIDSTVITRSDLIRRRWLDNDFYGLVYSINYNNQKGLNIILGGGWNEYKGKHFGEVIWARFASNGNIRHRYYDNDALKNDLNTYLKINYELFSNLYTYLDLQYRVVHYSFLGYDNDLRNVQQSVTMPFFNPKAGVVYELNSSNSLYASYAVAHREPTRNDFTESTPTSRPKPERLENMEAGYRFQTSKFLLNTNYFLMNYKNQLVLTGQINDVGAYTRTNIDNSYRTGIEIEAAYKIINQLTLSGNVTYSQNKIKEFNEYLDDYDNYTQVKNTYTNTDIAFSPNLIGGATLTYTAKGFEIAWISKYVSEQYLDNTMNPNRKLDAFFVNNLRTSYSFKSKWVKEVVLSALINNILNEEYEPNGYTFSYIYGGKRITENYYYPMAGRNFLASLTLKF